MSSHEITDETSVDPPVSELSLRGTSLLGSPLLYVCSQPSWLRDSVIFLTEYGSHAYGMVTTSSDLDVRGICIPPKEY